jgi:hypothetical protein
MSGCGEMDPTTAVGLLAAGRIPEAPVGLGRPAIPRTQYEADLRLIAALQTDRADQVERARRAEATVDYLQGCLAAVGCGVDLLQALHQVERDNQRLRAQVQQLPAQRERLPARDDLAEIGAAAARYITILDVKWRAFRDRVPWDGKYQHREQAARERWQAARGEEEQTADGDDP